MCSDAAYLLENLQGLTEQLALRRNEIIEASSGSPSATSGKRDYRHSDPTATKALLLLNSEEMAKHLVVVQRWIDTQLPPGERPLLLAVWRYKDLGWHYVAKSLGMEAAECQRRWENLTCQLQAYMRHCAGHVCVSAGGACVSGHGKSQEEK